MSKDKELSQKLPLIPFGKYKGQPVEVLKQDPKYVEWLKGQDWFSSQHKSIYTLIVNNFGIASETPEHNEMQVKFLDEWYSLKLAYVIVGDKLFKCNQKYFEDRLSAFLELVRRGIEERERGLENKFSKGLGKYYSQEDYGKDKTRTTVQLREWLANFKRQLEGLPQQGMLSIGAVEFEKKGVDVSYSLSYGWGDACKLFRSDFTDLDALERNAIPGNWKACNASYDFTIELKPQVGDDFPGVLRQMKASQSRVLVLKDYTGTGVNQEKFNQYFTSQKIRVVFEREIERTVLPEFERNLRIPMPLKDLRLIENALT